MSTCNDDVVVKPNESVAQLDPLPLVSSTTQPTWSKRKVTVPDGDNAHKKGRPGMSITIYKCQLQAKSPEIRKEKAARMSASGLEASDVRGPGNAPGSSKGGTTVDSHREPSSPLNQTFLFKPTVMSAVPQSPVKTSRSAISDKLRMYKLIKAFSGLKIDRDSKYCV
ncbi:hypothetical protein DPEC_G00312490 [Dallia pectoralis]|uniref:Uncharacterized protein n=1 Tax=Dallia pectoralis TaxID=75939 RepID=A0ACC2FBM0_DALPE|nr:hypothetical protein DPEC_G00312490 [Dallia pectoralis]